MSAFSLRLFKTATVRAPPPAGEDTWKEVEKDQPNNYFTDVQLLHGHTDIVRLIVPLDGSRCVHNLFYFVCRGNECDLHHGPKYSIDKMLPTRRDLSMCV